MAEAFLGRRSSDAAARSRRRSHPQRHLLRISEALTGALRETRIGPALSLEDGPSDAAILAMITSAGHRRWPLDVPLVDLTAAGLPAPSMVRLKLFTLDDRLVERRVGALGPPDASAVQGALGRLFGGLGG